MSAPRGVPLGDYFLQRRIGQGGMAEIFVAKRSGARGFEKTLVIKRLLPHLASKPRVADMFLHEARVAAALEHPNLVHVSDFGEVDGQFFIAMEHVDGLSLAELLQRAGVLAPGPACRIALDVLEALHAIHSAAADGQPLGLVHRDVSPRNVMVSREGGVKLLDLGIATDADTPAQPAAGTRGYMAPEQRRGEAVSARTDLFALGVLLHQLLSGALPQEPADGSAPSWPAQIPQDLRPLLESLLAQDPDARPGDARRPAAQLGEHLAKLGAQGTHMQLAELVEQLADAARAEPAERSQGTVVETQLTRRTETEARRPRWPLWAGLVATCALLVVGLRWYGSSAPAALPTTGVEDAGNGTDVALANEAEGDSGGDTAASPATTHRPGARPSPPRRVPRKAPQRREVTGHGYLTIDTQPWTEVYLDGRKLGMTPIEGVEVPAGRLVLELRNPSSGKVWRRRVQIEQGELRRLRLELELEQ